MQLPDHFPKPDLHPDRLRALAILFGLNPPKNVAEANMLFIGVSAGSNVLAIAAEYPTATITAICINKSDLNNLQDACTELHINNVTWALFDTWISTESDQKFDYITCHCYYSYLEREKKLNLLAHIASRISDTGLIYIDYLIQPGWQNFANLQYLLQQTGLNEQNILDDQKINQCINLVFQQLPPNSPLRATLQLIVPEIRSYTHPSLNEYWALQYANADYSDDFLEDIHNNQIGFAFDSDIQRYFTPCLSEELIEFCGNNQHAQDNLRDLITDQASRASILSPMHNLIGFKVPSKEQLIDHIDDLHISGSFHLDSENALWVSKSNPTLIIAQNTLNNLIITSLNQTFELNQTLSVHDLLARIHKTFAGLDEISQHATNLLTDFIINHAVHLRSQEQHGFLHQKTMLALHQWRLENHPYLSPSDKWLQPWSESEVMAALNQDS